MRTIIAGTRTFTDRDFVFAVIDQALQQGLRITRVLCGEARGVDQIGREWAEKNGILVVSYPAKWREQGNAAGPIRNQLMARDADALILIWDGQSRGSANMLHHAQMKRLRIIQRFIHPEMDKSGKHRGKTCSS